MLSKEEIANAYEALSRLVESQYSVSYPFHNPVSRDAELAIREIKAHITAMEENATAQALALKAAKAMQQAETERADKAESELQRINRLAQCGTVQNFLALSDDEKGKAFAVMMRTDKAQIDMINELEALADASERDAKRYRWLLQQAWFQSACDRYDLEDRGLQNKFEELLGVTIDQAMRNL